MTMAVTSPFDSVWGQTIMRFFSLLPTWHCTRDCVGVMRGHATTSRTRGMRGVRCSLSWQEVAARRLTWWCQLCNGRVSNNDDSGSNDNDDNNMKTTTMKTASTAAGSIGINTGMEMAAALCQGSTMQGKCIQCQC
jgi:hypothetical protein